MLVLILYDIVKDNIRNKVSDCCLDYGLERIQYSAFRGNLSRTHYEELLLKLKRIVGKNSGVVQGFQFCQNCEQHCNLIGKILVAEVPKIGVLSHKKE